MEMGQVLINMAKNKLPVALTPKISEEKLLGMIIESWKLSSTQDLMLARKMVSCWKKMERVEEMLSKLDLYFERFDSKGNLSGVQINELAKYLQTLEADFRSYYKTLNNNQPKTQEDQIQDFQDFLRNAKPVK